MQGAALTVAPKSSQSRGGHRSAPSLAGGQLGRDAQPAWSQSIPPSTPITFPLLSRSISRVLLGMLLTAWHREDAEAQGLLYPKGKREKGELKVTSAER